MSNKDNYTLQIDDVERRLIVVALSDLKDKQKEKNKSFDFLDDLIVKVCDAQKGKMRLFGGTREEDIDCLSCLPLHSCDLAGTDYRAICGQRNYS